MKSNLCTTSEQIVDLVGSKKNVIWDWNGTLLNDVEYVLDVINPLLDRHGLKRQSVDTYKEVFGFPVRDYYIKMGFDLEKNCFSKLSDDFHEAYYANFGRCEIFSSARRCLDEFSKMGKSQAVLSASDQKALDQVLQHYQLTSYFHHVYGISDRLAASKVQRGKELIEKSGFYADQTILIGDTDHDLEVGQEMGVQVILVSHGHQSINRLKAIHDLVV